MTRLAAVRFSPTPPALRETARFGVIVARGSYRNPALMLQTKENVCFAQIEVSDGPFPRFIAHAAEVHSDDELDVVLRL